MTLFEVLKTVNINNYVTVAWLDGEIEEKVYHFIHNRKDLHNRVVTNIFVENNQLVFYLGFVSEEEN